MIITRRQALAAAGGAMAVTAVGACSGEGSDPNAPVTINMALGGAANDYTPDDDNVIATTLGDAIGAQVVHQHSPEDLAASLAAGDAPDIFRVDRNQLQRFVEQGLVLDLSDYQDQLGDYVDFVGEETAGRGVIDGKLSAITRYQNNVNGVTYWIRQDWLDNLGLETPTTLEEFREVLRAFTEDDPDGNGQNDTYGLTGAAPDPLFRPLWGSFGTPGPGTIYLDESGELRSGYEDEGVADAIAYIADLQTSGYVDPDSYSLSSMEARDRGFQGGAGVMAQSWTAVKKQEAEELAVAANPDAEWVQLDLFPTADGSDGVIPVKADAVFFALPATLAGDDTKVEKIIELINYVSTEEGNRLVLYGVEGTHYELGADGRIEPLPAMAEEGGYFFVYQLVGRDELPYLEVKFPDQQRYFERAHDQPVVTDYQSFITSPDGFNQSEADRFSEEQLVSFLTGATAPSEYPAFVDSLKSQFGYDAFVEAAATQLDDLGVRS
ncbi:extracellular solute-binding protein [Ruania albidiflava]|uniref:extracellular solute-binding protein n=1 Tax=Ruania albidiflava TaxID=366586 RepID=UPI0003B37C52|nr:extracellular solute-binding protein [Ruania albidiflava]